MNVGKAMFAVSPAFSNISRMRETFDQLQVQLATGKKAQTLSDMGSGRGTSIDISWPKVRPFRTILQWLVCGWMF